jgi:hypothetical protein
MDINPASGPVLEDVPDLTLAFLNEATLAWAEYEYNRKVHSEIGEAPIARFLAGPDVMRPSPDSATLKLAFTKADRRTQRRSDGTIVIEARTQLRRRARPCRKHGRKFWTRPNGTRQCFQFYLRLASVALLRHRPLRRVVYELAQGLPSALPFLNRGAQPL